MHFNFRPGKEVNKSVMKTFGVKPRYASYVFNNSYGTDGLPKGAMRMYYYKSAR